MRKPFYAICEQQRRSLISVFNIRCLDSTIPVFAISKVSPILIIFVMGASNKSQGGLVTSFSIIDYLYTGNQQLNAKKWFREKIHLVTVAGQNHYFKDGLLFEAV